MGFPIDGRWRAPRSEPGRGARGVAGLSQRGRSVSGGRHRAGSSAPAAVGRAGGAPIRRVVRVEVARDSP